MCDPNDYFDPEQEYDDSLRLDEMQCVDDYNRFEENQLALDRDHEDLFDEEDGEMLEDDEYFESEEDF